MMMGQQKDSKYTITKSYHVSQQSHGSVVRARQKIDDDFDRRVTRLL